MAAVTDISVILECLQNNGNLIICVVLWLCGAVVSVVSFIFVLANEKRREMRNILISGFALLCFNAILYEFMLARSMACNYNPVYLLPMACNYNPVYLILVINHILLVVAMLILISICIKVVRYYILQ